MGRHVRWNHHVPRYLRPYAKGNHCSCTILHEGQDHRTTRAKVLCLDRWFHSRLPLYLPANVDLKARVRREWTFHCPPQVLLSVLQSICAYITNFTNMIKTKKTRAGPFPVFSCPTTCLHSEKFWWRSSDWVVSFRERISGLFLAGCFAWRIGQHVVVYRSINRSSIIQTFFYCGPFHVLRHAFHS